MPGLVYVAFFNVPLWYKIFGVRKLRGRLLPKTLTRCTNQLGLLVDIKLWWIGRKLPTSFLPPNFVLLYGI